MRDVTSGSGAPCFPETNLGGRGSPRGCSSCSPAPRPTAAPVSSYTSAGCALQGKTASSLNLGAPRWAVLALEP
eukprot:364988-Rhodomonas_salina.1